MTYAKLSVVLFGAICFVALSAGCEKVSFFRKKVKITGYISQNRNLRMPITKSSDNPHTLSDAAKVLVFYGRDYDLVNIASDGSFTARAPLGTATAIAFLTSDFQFIGNLFAGGMNVVPLVSSTGELPDINLDELYLDGYRVIPVNDPLLDIIALSPAELAFMQELDDYYEALAKNIDMDNNGSPDVMQHGKIDITFGIGIGSGICGLNGTPASVTLNSVHEQNYSIFIEADLAWISSGDNSLPQNAYLTGPDNNTTLYESSDGSYSNNKNFKILFESQGNQPMIFPPGVYTLHIDNKEFSFYFSTIRSNDYRVVVKPELITDSQNRITSILFSYEFFDGNPVDPRRLFGSGIDLNISDASGNFLLQVVSELDSPTDNNYDFYTMNLSNPIDLTDVQDLKISYIDIFGNSVSCGWYLP